METTANENVIPMGTASVADIVIGIPAPTEEEIKAAKEGENKSVYAGVIGAVTKLQEELKKAKNTDFANPIIGHLIERCKESDSLANDVCQEHKTWDKCYKYIYEQARKQSNGNCAAVRDDVVYEWAEDYFRKDDKKEEEEKAKKEAERKKKEAERKKQSAEKKVASTSDSSSSKGKSTASMIKQKPETKKKEADGQMSIFDFM